VANATRTSPPLLSFFFLFFILFTIIIIMNNKKQTQKTKDKKKKIWTTATAEHVFSLFRTSAQYIITIFLSLAEIKSSAKRTKKVWFLFHPRNKKFKALVYKLKRKISNKTHTLIEQKTVTNPHSQQNQRNTKKISNKKNLKRKKRRRAEQQFLFKKRKKGNFKG
jgi:hypothetical protein